MTARARAVGSAGLRRGAPVVARFDPRAFRWAGIPAKPYKTVSAGPLRWKGVERFVLVGARGEPTAFQLRYFEIEPGGHSSFEQHRHAHAVLIVRGRGRVRVGGAVRRVGVMDFVYVPPEMPHQFLAGREPFGFVCPVDAVRDRPRPARRDRPRPARLTTPRGARARGRARR